MLLASRPPVIPPVPTAHCTSPSSLRVLYVALYCRWGKIHPAQAASGGHAPGRAAAGASAVAAIAPAAPPAAGTVTRNDCCLG